MDCKVEFDWADGHYQFALRLAQLEELQEKANAGPQEILRRLQDGTWRTQDVRETLRLGLIGMKMPASEAFNLVKRYVDDMPWAQNAVYAAVVLAAAVFGVPDDKPGKFEADSTTEDLPAETENSDSQLSMELDA